MARPQIPFSFAKLATQFPDHARHSGHQLLTEIGGGVRSILKDTDNTCAVRLSYAMNHAGLTLHRNGAHAYWLHGAPRTDPKTTTWVKPKIIEDLYVIRVPDMQKYLTKEYGEPTLIWDGYTFNDWKVPFRGPTQGICLFAWKGPYAQFQATGHADLFRFVVTADKPPQLHPTCVDQCYFRPGPMYLYLWEMLP
jgi:Type VI secretion system (T6SS), amidase effector protein 4